MTSKRDIVLLLIALIGLFALFYRNCIHASGATTACYKFPSHNINDKPPAGITDTFALSQDYPATFTIETQPWSTIDFHTNPSGYGQAVLSYCLQGNTAIDFKVQNNTVRKWYHVPWLHYGNQGREWHHGMTSERSSRPFELHPNQTASAFTWAVGFYNPPGGVTIGKVWPDCGQDIPKPRECNFPNGTVTFKLLFTSATNAQVPYMQNSFSWVASTGSSETTRTDHTMRLLQVDIAVKDSRSPVGWVFGTFVYDGYATGATPWERLKLVGLIWGNDPATQSHMNDGGVFINPDIHESWINSALIPAAGGPVENAARAYHLGLGGRLNGPVDNLISSCISCHGKAAVLKDPAPDPIENIGRVPRIVASGVTSPATMTVAKFTDFFGVNIPGNSNDITYNCFISGLEACSGATPAHTFINTDYSLQVAVGIENYYSSLNQRAQEFLDQQQQAKNGQE